MKASSEILNRYAADVPPALRERMLEALATALEGQPAPQPGTSEAAEWLASAARDRLRTVLQSSGERAAAIDLLAADALLTHACEAAAEAGPGAFDALLREFIDGIVGTGQEEES